MEATKFLESASESSFISNTSQLLPSQNCYRSVIASASLCATCLVNRNSQPSIVFSTSPEHYEPSTKQGQLGVRGLEFNMKDEFTSAFSLRRIKKLV